MTRTYQRSDLISLLEVSSDFIVSLEQEDIVCFTPEGLCSEEDFEKARMTLHFMNELGVNLEGVEVILHMRQTMIEMQSQFWSVLRLLSEEMRSRTDPPR